MENVLAVTVEEAARRLSVSPRTVSNLIAKGAIDSTKIGRRRIVPVSSLETLLRERGERKEALSQCEETAT
jgi:excisionase family DNA binding protein